MKEKNFASRIRKAFGRLFRRNDSGTAVKEVITVDPEKFRRTFRAAYPDGARFMESLYIMQGTDDAFMLPGSFIVSGFVSAYGLSQSYRDWERKALEHVKEQHPGMKVLVFRYDGE